MLDNKVATMTPGEALLEAPIGELIQRIASSIAEAQLKLDQIGVRVATLLSEAKVTFNKADGTPVEKSLLELGFLPTFYAFTETDIEVKMTIQLKVEEEFSLSGEASVGGGGGSGVDAAKRVVPFGISISADYHRKYAFDMSGSSMVKTRLVSVPAPSVFLETVKEHARSQGLARETDTPGGDGGTTTSPGAPTPVPG
jgi:hypothetical protein